jgi:hypothetical protein
MGAGGPRFEHGFIKKPAPQGTNMNRFSPKMFACAAAVLAMVVAAPAAVAATHDHAVKPAAAAHKLGSSWDSDTFGIHLTIENNTNQAWTFDPGASVSGGHWVDRPQQTLAPGKSEVVTTESDSVNGLDTEVTYQMANGEYASFEGFDDWTGPNTVSYAGVSAKPLPYEYNEQGNPTPWPTDSSWSIIGEMTHGDHPDAIFFVSPASA